MRAEFNTLVETLKRWDLYQIGDEVDMDLKSLEDKITEVEKRMVCIEKCAEEINKAIGRYTERVDNNETFVMSVTDHDSIMRGSHDIEIALDLKDKEVIENNWYGLFAEPKLEEPPTYQSSEPETFDKVKQVIETLKTLHNGDCVDGETMQYILERIGMTDQMLRQLVMSNPDSDTKDLLEEKRILSDQGKLETNLFKKRIPRLELFESLKCLK
jgi:hypothetical protein